MYSNLSMGPYLEIPGIYEMDNDTALDFAIPFYSYYESGYPVVYRVIATFLHVVIFILGVPGNILLIFVALTTKSLQSPTYRYLISLAFADLLVLLSTIPEAIFSYHSERRWVGGQAACSVFVFTNFLGINAGSLSILAFTIEIYVAVCRPLVSQRICTIIRTSRFICCLWLFAILYCSVWLGLTEVKPDPSFSDRHQCDFRLSKHQYIYIFGADLFLFYIMPLIIAGVVYSKIAIVLHRSLQDYKNDIPLKLNNTHQETEGPLNGDEANIEMPSINLEPLLIASDTRKQLQKEHSIDDRMRSRANVLRILVVIVVLFAISWLPYRGLLVYNTFLHEPWLDLWYLFFAKTMIYMNSAMNPFLYAFLSTRFRRAAVLVLTCRHSTGDSDECETPIDAGKSHSVSKPSFDIETVHNRAAVSAIVSNGSMDNFQEKPTPLLDA